MPRGWRNSTQILWQPEETQLGHPPSEWLETLWIYLQKHFPEDLSQFENLPLIPMSSGDERKLVPLSTNSCLVLRTQDGLSIDKNVENTLEILGVIVLDELPLYVKNHPKVVRKYVHTPSMIGIVSALKSLCDIEGITEITQQFLDKTELEEKRALRTFLSRANPSDYSDHHLEVMCQLPIFETLEGSGCKKSYCVSATQVTMAAPLEVPQITISRPLIDIRGNDSKVMADILGIHQLTGTGLLTEVIFPDVESAFYPPEDIEKLMTHVLRHLQVYSEENPKFPEIIGDLAFLPRGDCMFVPPNRYFDPEPELLQSMFVGEQNFPAGVYATPPILASLREVGLKGVADVEAADLADTADAIQYLSESDELTHEELKAKSAAFLNYLQKYPQKLEEKTVENKLKDELREVRWVSKLDTKPESYPSSLQWHKDETLFYKPSEIKSFKYNTIIGSVTPVVEPSVSEKICDTFGWNIMPNISLLVSHLKNTVEAFSLAEKAKYMAIITGIYSSLMDYNSAVLIDALQNSDVKDWVWHGEGFTSSERIVFQKPFVDLRPYVYCLPSEVEGFTELFSQCGVAHSCDLPDVLYMMKGKYDSSSHVSYDEIKKDIRLATVILNELKPKAGEDLPDYLHERLLIPVHVEGDTTLRLAQIKDCTYCDTEWLKQGHDLTDVDDDEEELLFVHQNIPNRTSERLGVPTLMSRMLDAEELDISFGQTDSLTHRLNVLLQEYTDGFAVPKEVVQNADDAGATEVKFLYDERDNMDARTCLIDEGMKECQGPALWAYNDAVFTDEDFENITKLSGATKENQTEKIGRFGLGFNAVYNLTDVPSFVSRNNIIIFDPHTDHLGKGIKNKSKPGIKIDMTKHRRKLRKLGNQFKPYNDVFGCDLRPDSKQESFNASLFRFPLRTKEQAIRSEICKKHYDDKEVKDLLQMLVKSANSLLLFTQNVVRVTVYHLPSYASSPSNPIEMFSVSKEPMQILRSLSFDCELPKPATFLPLDDQRFIKESSVLRACTQVLNTMKQQGKISTEQAMPESSMVISVRCHTTRDGSYLLGVEEESNAEPWLIVSCMGEDQALKMSFMEENLLPSSGVAVPLFKYDGSSYLPRPALHPDSKKHYGSIFCYLPLPIHSGLPLHINGAFAVTSSRRYLCERNEDDKFDMRALWNDSLMQDSVCRAYIMLLDDLRTLVPANEGNFYELWPRMDHIDSSLTQLAQSFYRTLADEDQSFPALMSDGTNWVNMADAVFIEPSFRSTDIGDAVLKVMKSCLQSTHIIDLPDFAFRGFEEAGCMDKIKEKSYGKVRFLEEIFFPNILEISSDLRDTIVLFVLEDHSDEVQDLLRDNACIPVSPSGDFLKYPSQLIDPFGEVAKLYSPDDERFPFAYGETSYCSNSARIALQRLGMAGDELGWSDLLDRAYTVQDMSYHDGMKRTAALFNFIDRKLEFPQDEEEVTLSQIEFMNIKLFPILQKPLYCSIAWKGEEFKSGELLTAKEVYLPEARNLVCCTSPLIDTEAINFFQINVRELFQLQEKPVNFEQVMEQLYYVTTAPNLHDRESFDLVQKTIHGIYEYLLFVCQEENAAIVEIVKEELENRPFILCHGQFLSPQQLAFKFPFNCAPYLYGLSDDIARKYGPLMEVAGVRKNFEMTDYVVTLQKLRAQHGVEVLKKDQLDLALRLARLLCDCLSESKQSIAEVVHILGPIYIPDSKGMLCSASELCYNEPDCQWLPDDDNMRFSHPLIPYTISKQLGVNTKRQEVLRKHSKGIPFGQKERLTTRLKRILSGYPCDKEILKELLQNADDARATEIHFVKDPRRHSDEKVFEECWKPLQGPALCVYNNSAFTEEDLEGIKNLGEGSKGKDPNKTGQYGIGFNCVYHLTDTPSFLSCGPDIGETLVVFDPHARYVPGVTQDEPGRRYDNVKELRSIFTDVFPCYLEDKFNLENGTMFRFPLRTMSMATKSELSDSHMPVEAVDRLLSRFKPELFENLLFVNCVQKISISDVDRLTNRLSNTYTVTAHLSEEDQEAREEFAGYIKEVGKRLKAGKIDISSVPVKEISYEMTLEDNKGYKERWFIVQRAGFEIGATVPNNVIGAFKRGDIMLLPRAGVAALLETSKMKSTDKPRKAYCFLPLPLTTSLPVHINGHFALDHEARRDLWRDDSTGPKGDWNNTVISQIIAPTYVSLLKKIRSNVFGIPMNSEQVYITDTEANIKKQLKHYLSLFPSTKLADEYWSNLSKAVFQYISAQKCHLLPVIRTSQMGDPDLSNMSLNASYLEQNTKDIRVDWLPPSTEGKQKAYFDNLRETFLSEDDPQMSYMSPLRRRTPKINKKSSRKVLKEFLLSSGFNIIKAPLWIYEGFLDSEAKVDCVSPTSVLKFLKTHGAEKSQCYVGDLPADISDTTLKDEKTLITVLKYCGLDTDIPGDLQGLPLELTDDNVLRTFDSNSPKYLTTYYDLLPECGERFIHRSLVHGPFSEILLERVPVFQKFNIEALAKLLEFTLPKERFYDTGNHTKWTPDGDVFPNQQWIAQVWAFIRREANRMVDSHPMLDEEIPDAVTKLLKPLYKWSLLPAAVNRRAGGSKSYFYSTTKDFTDYFLVPIGMPSTVMDFSQAGIMSFAIRESLRKFGVPELATKMLDGTALSPSKSISSSNAEIAKMIVASLEKPTSVLSALEYLQSTGSIHDKIKTEECNDILKYFNDSADVWKDNEDCIVMLKGLPFYLTVHGDLISIAGKTVYVLPTDVPTADMDAWESRSGIIFLRHNAALKDLHNHLECLSLDITEVYCQFIFEHFEYLSPRGRISHLEFLRDSKLPRMSDFEKVSLIKGLKGLCFLPSENGCLLPANNFYDPHHNVFKVFFQGQTGQFPPRPFSEFKWLDFLRQIGLIHKISMDMCVDFATQLSEEAENERNEETFNKSRALVSHMFKRKNLVTEGLLTRIKSIAFIPPVKVNTTLQNMHHQYGQTDESKIPYVPFEYTVPEHNEFLIWTSVNLLPHWANPQKLTSKDVNYDYPVDDIFADFEAYTSEITKQLDIHIEPSTEQVVAHCQNICNAVSSRSRSSHDDFEDLSNYMTLDVMKFIYKFLQSHSLDDDTARDILQDTPCLVVESGKKLVTPKQVVINLYQEEEIKPLLYKAPAELGEYQKLFKYLGATETAVVEQFAFVLEKVHDVCMQAKMHPNELVAAFKAVKGLLTTLDKHGKNGSHMDVLYLPSQDGRLHASSSLVYNDDPSYTDRLRDFDKPFLVDLTECDIHVVSYSDLIMKLPENHQPKMLTALVQEKLEKESEETQVMYGVAEKLRQQLTSTAFAQGVVRLIRHEHHRSARKLQAEVVLSVQNKLKSIHVYGVQQVMTFLEYESDRITGSEAESECFVEKHLDEETGEPLWHIYIQSSATLNEELLVSVAEVVNRIVGGLLNNSVHYLQPILSCQAQAITGVLNRLKIRPDDSVKGKQPTLPLPGHFIPLEDHHLLCDDFMKFEKGEYVGYETDDNPENGGTATYIYAIIVEEEKDEKSDDGSCEEDAQEKAFKRLFVINIGDDNEPIAVPVTDLYKFHRVERIARSRDPSMCFSEDMDQSVNGDAANDEGPVFDNDDRNYASHSKYHESKFYPQDNKPQAARNGYDKQKGHPPSGRDKKKSEPETPKTDDTDGPKKRKNYQQKAYYEHEKPSFTQGRPKFRTGEMPQQDMPRPQQDMPRPQQDIPRPQQDMPRPQQDMPRPQQDIPKPQQDMPREESRSQTPPRQKSPPKQQSTSSSKENEQNMDEICDHLSEQLEGGWKLPEKERKKVIKRLLLKWHPDKNPDNQDFATKITQHIHSEIERLELGIPRQGAYDFGGAYAGYSDTFKKTFYEAFYRNMNERAARHKEQREEYQKNFSREYAYTKPETFDVPPSFSSSNPQPSEAKRWLRQAQADMKAATNDYHTEAPAYEWVCFKCHQVCKSKFISLHLHNSNSGVFDS